MGACGGIPGAKCMDECGVVDSLSHCIVLVTIIGIS